ncbi:MAG: ATP-binding protein [Dehalococcoidia bacterium]|nr:ATP-binding protein [Dehalococcoidia bacterium]
MKISVCGKGGSGKSVIVALLADEIKRRGYQVLVVDSDESNSALYRILGFDQPPEPILELVGGKKKLQQKMASRFSSGESEPKMSVLSQDKILVKEIPPQHIRHSNGLALVNIGKILHSLEGCACPMGVLTREFLVKLSLDDKGIAVVDMEAGIEHFGRGVATSLDTVLIVVEPSFESLQLASRISVLAAESGVRMTKAVLNKVASPEMAAKLQDELKKRGIEPIGVVRYDPEIFAATLEGRKPGNCLASDDIKHVVDALLPSAKS